MTNDRFYDVRELPKLTPAMAGPVATLDASRVEGTLAAVLLQWIDELDRYGARTWNFAHVVVLTALILGAIRVGIKKQWNVDWYSVLHAAVTGYGSAVCVYLSVFAAEQLTGSKEPLRSIQCQGPLTSLHRLLPAITAGYGLFDIIEGLHLGMDFVCFLVHLM